MGKPGQNPPSRRHNLFVDRRASGGTRWAILCLPLLLTMALVACGGDGGGKNDPTANNVPNNDFPNNDGNNDINDSPSNDVNNAPTPDCEDDADCVAEGACRAARCEAGACVDEVAEDGAACDDGDACTQRDVCVEGVCVGDEPVECEAQACAGPGTCDPMTGACTPGAPVENGVACDDGDACTQLDVCVQGVCVGDEPVVCDAPGACQAPDGRCEPETGACVYDAMEDGESCDDGEPCTVGETCQAGACVPGNALPDGFECDDADLCTRSDVCAGGVCVGQDPVVCEAPACHEEGACDPDTGMCVFAQSPDASPCDDGNDCTATDLCLGGVCTGGQIQDDGAACDDGNACTQGTTCAAGQCEGGSFVVCEDRPCLTDGVCDPDVGRCVYTEQTGRACSEGCGLEGRCVLGVCEGGLNPCDAEPVFSCNGSTLQVTAPVGVCAEDNRCEMATRAVTECAGGCVDGACVDGCAGAEDGAACEDGDLCTAGDVCRGGRCVAGAPVTCEGEAQPCEVLWCNPGTGGCEVTPLADGAACDDQDGCTLGDVCQGGVCVGEDAQEVFEPNDAPGEARRLTGANGCNNNLDSQLHGILEGDDDVDRFQWRDNFGGLFGCPIKPAVELTSFAQEGTTTLCAYHECGDGQPTGVVCLSGSPSNLGPPNTAGCCVEVPAGETGRVHMNPECPGSDEGDIHVVVSGEGVLGCGYQLRWGNLKQDP